MYNSTQSTAWFKKSLLVTSLLTAIYQTSAGAADTTAKTTSSASTDDSSERMTVTAPAPLLKAGSEHRSALRSCRIKGPTTLARSCATSRSLAPPAPAAVPATAKRLRPRRYTGYNIRGMESNRVGIDVDGIAQPNATGRIASRAASIPSVWAATILTLYVRQHRYSVRGDINGNRQQRHRRQRLFPPEIRG